MKSYQTNVSNKTTICLTYSLNQNNWYELISSPPAFNKLPRELKIEETVKTQIVNAPYVIHGRQIKGVKEFFTGLRTYKNEKYFFGNKPEYIKGKKTCRLLVFVLSEDIKTLKVYYTFKLYQYTKEIEGWLKIFFDSL